MDIETFVKDTIGGVIRGVAAAQRDADGSGARINPRVGREAGRTTVGTDRQVSQVAFSIAVTVEDSSQGSGGIKVLGVSAGADAKNLQSEISRVEFEVPVSWPPGNGD